MYLKKEEVQFEGSNVVVFITAQYQIMIDLTRGWLIQKWQPALVYLPVSDWVQYKG